MQDGQQGTPRGVWMTDLYASSKLHAGMGKERGIGNVSLYGDLEPALAVTFPPTTCVPAHKRHHIDPGPLFKHIAIAS